MTEITTTEQTFTIQDLPVTLEDALNSPHTAFGRYETHILVPVTDFVEAAAGGDLDYFLGQQVISIDHTPDLSYKVVGVHQIDIYLILRVTYDLTSVFARPNPHLYAGVDTNTLATAVNRIARFDTNADVTGARAVLALRQAVSDRKPVAA